MDPIGLGPARLAVRIGVPLLLVWIGCARDSSAEWEVPELPPFQWGRGAEAEARDPAEWQATPADDQASEWSLEVIDRVRMRGVQFSSKERVVRQRLRLLPEEGEVPGTSGARWRVTGAEVEVTPALEESEELLQEDLEGLRLSPEDLRGGRRPPGPAREVGLALWMGLPFVDLGRHVGDEVPWPFRWEEVREVKGHGEVALAREGTLAWAGAEGDEEGARWRLHGEWTIQGQASGSREGVRMRGQGRGQWWLDPRTGWPDRGEAVEAATVRVSRGVHSRWLEMAWTTEVRLQREEAP